MKNYQIYIFCCLLMLTGFNLTSCGGGGAEIQATNSTMGEELIDLQEAYDKGVISEDEFKKAKKKILKKY